MDSAANTTRQNGPMKLTPDEAGEVLRARGMRSTPQRRAILSVFSGQRAEHLSAEEIFARATGTLPDLSRATVYATLAEFGEVGLLAAFGTPDPVRYETTVAPHAHFCCRLCLRIFDLESGRQDPAAITDPGFQVERIETRAEGICGECTDYDRGLRTGAQSIIDSGPLPDTLSVPGTAVAIMDSPLGELLLAASPEGLTRLAFMDHGDAANLRAHAATRRGSRTARQHLTEATASLQQYFAGELSLPSCQIGWDLLGPDAAALQAVDVIPYGSHRSYEQLEQSLPARDLGLAFGRNPVPIFVPCHRVSRGNQPPTAFVGGIDRRRWLEAHEQSTPH